MKTHRLISSLLLAVGGSSAQLAPIPQPQPSKPGAHKPGSNTGGGFDLASLNIQRGRDHGLPSIANMRKALKLPPVPRFEDITRDRDMLAELRKGYTSPAEVDLWVGGLCKTDRPGSIVGETFTRILVDQFRRCRDGDRFWYQSYLPAGLVRAVEQPTLATIIRRNTGIQTEISDNAFLRPRATEDVDRGHGVLGEPRRALDGRSSARSLESKITLLHEALVTSSVPSPSARSRPPTSDSPSC